MKLTPIQFVEKYAKYAKEVQEQSNIPALFILAQAALESGWGGSSIGNNLFGITANSGWKGLKQLVTTTEYHDNKFVQYPEIISITMISEKKYLYKVKRYFRDYATIKECFDDHLKVLLSPRYAKAFEHTNDIKLFAEEIQKGGYATAPDYAKTICSVANTVNRALVACGIML